MYKSRYTTSAALRKLFFMTVLPAIAVFAAVWWIGRASDYFHRRMLSRRSEYQLFGAAKRLHLTYDGALSNPDSAEGKPAVWCVQASGDGLCYEGKKEKNIFLVQGSRPVSQSLKEPGCKPTLLIIRRIKQSGPDPLRSRAEVYVEFIRRL